MKLWMRGNPTFGAALACIMGGCLVNVVVMEQILNRPGARHTGHLLTFGHFLFIALEGCTALFAVIPGKGVALRPRRLPLQHILLLVALHWATNVSNNVVFSYRISVPLHTVFRSLQLLTSMVLGFSFVKKRYSVRQVLAVLLVAQDI